MNWLSILPTNFSVAAILESRVNVKQDDLNVWHLFDV